MNCMAGVYTAFAPALTKILRSLFSSLFLDSFLLTISLYLCTDFLSSYPFFCFRVARPHLAHNLLIKCSDDFLRSLAHKTNYARVGCFFSAHKLLINIPWAAHRYPYIRGQFSALASIVFEGIKTRRILCWIAWA